MKKLVRNFVDLQREGRQFTHVPLTEGLAMLALACDPDQGDSPIGEDEDVLLRQNGYMRISATLYASLASIGAEAGVRGMYGRARTVDFDEARHVRETLPAGSGEDPAEVTLRVGIALAQREGKAVVVYENASRLRGDLTDSMRRMYAEQALLIEGALDELTARRDAPTPPPGP